MAKKRKRYDDKFRASAVAMLEGAGYPDKKGALTEVAGYIGVPIMTLSRWAKGKQNPAPNELVTEKKAELTDLLRDLAYKLVQAMPDHIEEASLQQQGTTLGIVIDKMQLLTGKPTERLDVTLSDEERATRIATLLDGARARRTGQSDSEYVQ